MHALNQTSGSASKPLDKAPARPQAPGANLTLVLSASLLEPPPATADHITSIPSRRGYWLRLKREKESSWSWKGGLLLGGIFRQAERALKRKNEKRRGGKRRESLFWWGEKREEFNLSSGQERATKRELETATERGPKALFLCCFFCGSFLPQRSPMHIVTMI